MATIGTKTKLESRVTLLEAKVEQLQRTLPPPEASPWWESIVGAFAGDPAFEEAMRLGQEYRESLRPKSARRIKPAKTRKRRNVRT